MKAEGSTAEARVVCRLVGLDGKTRQFDVPVNGPILIGRGPYNHITIDDVRVSRQHARVGRELDGYVVCDLNSVNGTYVNDVAVNRAILQPNDVIRCGPYSFQVEFRDAPERRTETSHDSDLPTGRYVASNVSMTSSALESTHDLPASSRSGGGIVDLVQLEAEHSNLRTLYSFVQSISKTIDKRELLPLMTDKIREIYPVASIVAIYLRSASKGWADEFRLAHSYISDSST
ncbi:MAG: FHA domain-containing protein, partial [Polyangiaceae bacterium]